MFEAWFVLGGVVMLQYSIYVNSIKKLRAKMQKASTFVSCVFFCLVGADRKGGVKVPTSLTLVQSELNYKHFGGIWGVYP